MTCTLCKLGYYLDSDGKCISFIDKIEASIPNCYSYYFNIGNYTFHYYPNDHWDPLRIYKYEDF